MRPGTRPAGSANRHGDRCARVTRGGRAAPAAARVPAPAPRGGHHAHDPARAPAAVTHQDLDREHAAEQHGHGRRPGDRGASWPAGG
jgi:hypothetical protein